ncbi:hypothetical protein NEPAR04_0080 [Nematocida parisii]|nr:hypothetical protein NEPAR08_0380 [Nematocida parisii]KAI5127176.1 hypothetical protein NEPAR03_0843 [Nematocida parisii]KAI5140106.1 hypothetical protein NEPAR04_0080 [Nematocida parisii]
MLKRVLEDITNICHTNIRVTIKKEEKPIRREILAAYLEYAETYYKHLNRVLSHTKEIGRKYEEVEGMTLYAEVEDRIMREKKSSIKEIRGIFTSTDKPAPSAVNSSLINRLYCNRKSERFPEDALFSIPVQDIFKAHNITGEKGSSIKRRKYEEYPREATKISAVKRPCRASESSSDEIDISTEEYKDRGECSQSMQVGIKSRKSQITMKMRQTLLEWMYDVKVDYKLASSIYQVAVRITDKYFLITALPKEKYQLVGAVSLFIANKLMACKSRSLMAYVDVCDGAYSKEEFLVCERDILMRMGGCLNFLLPQHIITEDKYLVGNALCEYASESVLLDASYACLAPKELSHFIESNISACLNGETPSPRFASLLKKSAVLLDQQIKQVRELVKKL